jgi:hypothetical protein
MLKTINSQFNLNFDNDFSKWEILSYQNISDKIFLIIWSKKDKTELFQNLKKDILLLYSQYIANSSPENSFENLIKEINEKYKNEIKNKKENWDNLDIILALSSWNNLYLTQTWNAECYLIRNWRLNIILEWLVNSENNWNENQEDENLFENIASWIFSNDDFVIFSNKRILKRFTAIEIIDFFDKWVAEWVESIEEVYENEEYSVSLIWTHVKSEIESWFWVRSNKIWKFELNLDYITQKFLPYTIKFLTEIFNKTLNFSQNKIENFIIFLSKKTNKSYEKVQKIFISTVFLWIIFILITFISFSSQWDSFKKEVYEKYKIEILKIDKNLEVAESRALMWSNIEANAILDKSEERLDEIFEKWILREKSLELSSRISKMRDDINKITRFNSLETKKMIEFSDHLWSWESLKWFFKLNNFLFAYTENKIFKTAVNKIEETFDFTEWERIKIAKWSDDIWLALVITEWNILYTFNWKNFEKQEFVQDKKLKEFTSIETYSKYFYLLDNWNNWALNNTISWTWVVVEILENSENKWNIWKYWKKYQWFSLPSDYLEGEDLSSAISVAIDWSVYILHKDWFISQYYSWKSVNFQYKWVSSIIKDATKIYTEPDFSKIYLQDFINNKIILIQKTKNWWEFLKQYIFETEKIIDFKVDINEQEMIALWENMIYKISLMWL